MKKLWLAFIISISFAYKAEAQIIFDGNKIVQPNDTDHIFRAVEVEPHFRGGMVEFNKYIKTNQKPIKTSTTGAVMVYIQFIVERNGTLTNIRVLRSPSEIYSAEAIRLLKLSPKWISGVQNGYHVRVYYSVPIILGNE